LDVYLFLKMAAAAAQYYFRFRNRGNMTSYPFLKMAAATAKYYFHHCNNSLTLTHLNGS